MSADKRSTHTDALATLGTIITEGGRDAIHLAVEPMEAGEKLYAGQDIGIKDGKAFHWGHCEKALGIVDPFLKTPVEVGQKFWLIVYPRQITSLRHVWEHPDFMTEKNIETQPETNTDSKQSSEQWLRDWCERTDDAPRYEDLIQAISTGESETRAHETYGGRLWQVDGEYLFGNGIDAHGEIPEAYEVKHHIEIVTGKKILSMPKYFSCSC